MAELQRVVRRMEQIEIGYRLRRALLAASYLLLHIAASFGQAS